MIKHYILNARGEPVIEKNFLAWARWMEKGKRQVGLDRVGRVRVSTVFLGLDASFNFTSRKVAPVLWETMVFGGKLDLDQTRCAGTREQAEAMHREMLARVRAAELPAKRKTKKAKAKK